MSVVSADIEPLTFIFDDDGLVPNNPLPFLVYKGAVDVANDHPEKTIEGLFGANGWARCGVTASTIMRTIMRPCMRCCGVARGHARVQFGGDARPGAGNFCRRRRDPPRRDWPPIDIGQRRLLRWSAPIHPDHRCRSRGRRRKTTPKALKTIPEVKLPKTDPVRGEDGPLVRLWKRRTR